MVGLPVCAQLPCLSLIGSLAIVNIVNMTYSKKSLRVFHISLPAYSILSMAALQTHSSMRNNSYTTRPPFPSEEDAPPVPDDEQASYPHAYNTKAEKEKRRKEEETQPAIQTATNPFSDTLTGVLERLTYHNEDNGYTVGRLAVEGARDLITIVGNFTNPVVGEQLVCEGSWTAHKEFGKQFAVERYNMTKPATAFAIEKYLGSGLIKGIGPVMAKRMVDLFGLETLDVIETDPRKLLRVGGIGEKRIEKSKRRGTSSAKSAT